MNMNFKIALAVVAGATLGAAAMQGLHAQSKPKAYTVNETEVLDAAALAVYVPLAQAAIDAAGGHNFNTVGGRIIAGVAAPPKRVSIIEWDSVEQVQAFANSAAWKNLAPLREKAYKSTRAYTVEAEN